MSEQKDSVNVTLPISLVKQANQRLIERKYLISIYYEQDSIIAFKDNYITYQNDMIMDMQTRIDSYNKINNHLNESLENQKKKTKVITYTSLGVVVGLLAGILAK